MAPANFDSSRQLPFVFKLLPAVGVLFLIVCFAVQTFLPHEKNDFVDWKDPKQAVELSRKSHKPIFYDFTAEWCKPCHALTDEVFRDKEFAKQINQEFVPVRVLDREMEESSNPLEVERLQKKYHVEGFPTLIITNPDSIEVKRQVDYPGKDKTKEFINQGELWATLEKDPYHVYCRQLDDAILASRTAQKPLLIMFWDEKGYNARFDYLANTELVQLIKSKFLPAEVLLPTNHEQLKSPEAQKLLAKLGMHRTPAMAIVPVDGSMPHFHIGECAARDNKEFLEKYLRLSCDKGAK